MLTRIHANTLLWFGLMAVAGLCGCRGNGSPHVCERCRVAKNNTANNTADVGPSSEALEQAPPPPVPAPASESLPISAPLNLDGPNPIPPAPSIFRPVPSASRTGFDSIRHQQPPTANPRGRIPVYEPTPGRRGVTWQDPVYEPIESQRKLVPEISSPPRFLNRLKTGLRQMWNREPNLNTRSVIPENHPPITQTSAIPTAVSRQHMAAISTGEPRQGFHSARGFTAPTPRSSDQPVEIGSLQSASEDDALRRSKQNPTAHRRIPLPVYSISPPAAALLGHSQAPIAVPNVTLGPIEMVR